MTTKETYAQKLQTAEEKLTAYVNAVNADTPLATAIASTKKQLDEAVAAYNTCVRSDAYEKLFLSSDDKPADPIHNALSEYRFTGLMQAKFKREKETGRIQSSSLVYTGTEVFHLRDIEDKWVEREKAAGAEHTELMHSADWSAKVFQMQRLFNASALALDGFAAVSGLSADYIVYDTKGNAFDVSDLSDAARAKLSDGTSVKALKPKLQAMVDAVYFDDTGRTDGANKYRVVEKDVRFVRDNALTFNKATHKTSLMSDALAFELAFCVVAHIVTGESYEAIMEG